MKKVISVITLIVMMSVNIMDPFTYAISLGDDFEEIQKFDEIVEDENFDDEEKIDDNGENNEILDIEQEDEDDINVGQDELEEIVENENEGKDLSGEGDENGEKEQEILLENIDEDGKEMVEWDEEASQSTGVLLTGGGNNILLEENEIEENKSDDNGGDTPIDVVDEMVETEILGLTGNVDILSGDISVLSGDIENLTGENVELTGTDLELAKARETLNTEVIQGRENSKNVVVYVEADIDTFPQGTQLKIKPIMVSNQLNEIKEQIKDSEKNVDDNSEIVAFDISFVYTLSDGSEKEIQPKNGEGVRVTFDYSDNKNLVKADENEEQEVKVFHLDDKDENGEKVAQGEEVVKDVTNIHESGEVGVVVVDAETFSIYAIVTTTSTSETISIIHNLNGGYWLEGSNPMVSRTIEYICVNNSCTTTTNYRTPSKTGYMFMGWFDDEEGNTRWIGENAVDGDEVYAKWQEFGDLDVYILGSDTNNKYHYTLMDRNMGAKSKNTAGYYYQRGNNFGFTSGWGKTAEGKIDTSNYSGSNPYMNSTFYLNAGDGNGNWINPKNPNLWGGNSSNTGDRQGPCPDGYHIPTITEWDGAKSKWKTYYDTSRTYSAFYKDFLIVGAGYLARGTASMAAGDEAKRVRYATSTLNGNGLNAKIVKMLGSDGTSNDEPKTDAIEWSANGMSVRCFKNIINTSGTALDISDIHLDGGSKAIISIASGEVVSLQNPTKAGHDFIGWYTNDSYTGTAIGVGSGIEAGSSLYAKYDCAQGYVEVERECVPGFKVVFDANTNGGTSGDNVVIVTGSSSITLDLGDYTAEKEGYYFVGWNTNAGVDTGLQGEQTFTQKTILYAIFLNLYTYTFVDEEGNILGTGYYQSGVVSDMNRLIPLEYYTNGKVADTSSYSALLTLGVEEGMGRRWIPELPKNGIATESLIITGEIDNAFTVTFLDGDGSSYLSYGVVSGSKIDYITGPEGEAGYQFVDWYEDAGLNVRFDFSTKTITGNTTIYPGFTEVLCTFTTENVTAGLKITGFSGTPTEECLTHFVIPSKIGGKIVKQIGYRAFKGKSISGEIILPDTVTYIGEEAFANNEISGKLKLPNNIENIDKSAFYNNKISGQLDLPESLTKVGVGAFATNNISGRLVIPGRINNGVVGSEYRCNPIEEVIFGIGTTEITKEAFADHGTICNDSTKHTIKHVEFPSTLQIIRNQAFNGQIIEGELELPNSLTIVEDGAFGGNKISGILRIPGSVTTVTNAFNCNPIEEVVFGEGITKINGNAFNADCNNKKDGKIEKITLPSTLTSIGDRAFKFQSLTGELIIPNGVTSIGYEAFTANKNKIGGQLIIPDSVISIGYNAFENNQITGLILGSSLQTIGNYAFKGNQLTGELIIPNSVTFIGNYAFDGYNGNNRIGGQLVIPDSVTFIGQYAFRNNQITGVILGNGLGTIEAGIFQNNKVGGQLIIPDSVISIGYNAFENNQITGLILGNNLQSIQQLAFNKNRLTGELIIPNSVQTIGNYAFDGNDGGNKISGQLIIPDSVISVGEYAFRSNQITGVILGNGLDTINLGVFYGNKIEGQLIIPDSVIYIGQSSFQNNQITGLVLGRNVDTIRQDAFNQNKLTGELVIPYSVTFIGKQAFDGANGGNKISGKLIIPDNVTYIGEYAFRSNQITSLKLGNSVETIRWNSFENNQIGGELIIPDSVTYIGECAFRSNQITGLVLGSGLNAIYKETFKNNQIEGEFIIPDDINTIGDEAFSNNKISGTLFIPGRINSGIVNNAFRANYLEKVIFGSGITYIKAYAFDGNGRTDLKRQIKSVEFPSTLTGIADYAFRQQRIECLELPDSLMNIGQYAFYQNKISGTLIIPDSVISIGRQSFDNQMSGSLYTLQSVVLGNNVQEVGYGAFLSNRNLKNVYIPDSVEILSGNVFSHNNNPYYTTGYLTTKKSTLNYTGAYLKPIYQLYSYTFVNENGDILGTGYYPEILTSNTTKLISLDYYNGIGNINDFTGADELITSPEGYKVVWSIPLSENSVVTESLVVTGSVEKVHTVVFKNPFTGDIVEYVENNGSLDAPEEYKVQGHTFTGWFSGDVKVDFPLPVTSDLILTGRYDINKYTVNFYEDEEETYLLTGGIFDYNTVLDVENPQKAGKAFGGWYYLSGSEEVFVKIPVVVDKDMNLYAKWGNAVSIVFDANGGKFSDDSTQKTIVYAEDGVCGGSTTYSHTSNVNDNGEKISNEYGNYQNRTDVVTIPGAKKLKVTITYQTEAINYDWVCVREGSHPEYSGSVDCTRRLGGTTTGTKEYIITGDTVTFGFKSDYNKNNYYGYYAIVTDVADYYTPIVEEPSREGLEFLGWYLDQSGNNPFVMSCDNRDKTVYAKWRGYTGWDGCYEYSTLGKDNNGDYIAEITAYSGADSCQKENLTITGTIVRNGRSYIVKKIGNSAFMSKGLSGTLTFPYSLSSIGGTAFAGNSITNLEIFPSIEYIGSYAFAGNSAPLTLVLDEGLTEIRSAAFASSNLTGEIILPSTISRVGSSAFQTNSYVKGITLNEGLTEIGGSAFGESYGLSGTSLVIPSSVKKIGGSAFNNINFSEIIILPYDVDIGQFAFNYFVTNGDSNLNKLVINGLSGGVINGDVFNLSYKNLETLQLGTGITGIDAPFRNSKITGLVIPDTVTSISSYVFQNNKDLKTIKLGTGLKTLNDYVFYNCTGVEYVDLGNLEYIGGSNFQGTQITGLVIPDSVTFISSSAFRSNKKLKTIKIGTGLKTLSNFVFGNCTGIEYVDLGELENIYGGNFQNTQITGLVIPDTVTTVYNGAFTDNSKLKTVKIGSGLKNLDNGVFAGCTGIETVDLGNIEYIGAANFYGTQMTGLVIPDSVTGIDSRAFINNTHLQTLTLGNSVRYIGNSAFANSALTGVSLPNSLTTLGTGVFCTDNGTNTGSVIGFIGDNPSVSAEQLEEQENTACFVIKNSTYQVNISLTGENMGDFTQDSELSGSKRYGKRIVIRVTPRHGYRFWKWEIDGNPVMTGDDEYWTGDLELVVISGMNITGFFTGDINTYTVRYRKQNIDDDDYSVVLSETGYGITDTQTNAEVKDFPGFTGLTFDQTGIKADGKTVVDIYYNRKLYTITFFDSGSVVTGIIAKYEKEISEPEISEKAGYHFSGWYYDSGELCEFPISMPLNGVNLTAQWIANTGTEYKVEYYLQNVDLTGYDFHLTGIQRGTSDTQGVAEVKIFTGFEFNSGYIGNIISGTIVGDGSLVLRLFYDRKAYTVSTGSNNETQGTVSVEGESRYGKRLIFRANVIDSSLYKFVKWELNGRFVTTGESDDFWTGDLVIENLTGDVIVTGYFVAYSGCVWDGGTITHGTSVIGYFTPTVPYGQTCVSEIRICNDGTLSGTYQYASCTPEEPLSCVLPWGGTTGHGAVVTGYKALSETCPAQCSTVSQVATCDNGNWNVENFTGIYTQPNCITQPVSMEGYDLDECPEFGICSSITGYTVNDNICTTGDTKYKLNDCESGWHTEDNVTCTGNTKYEACIPRQNDEKPEHSSNMPGIVPVHWAEGSGWETPVKCDWSCDTHYHTGDDLNSCDIDTFVVTINADVNSGSVSTGILEVDYGTVLTTSGNELRIGEEVVSEAIAKERDVQYTYRFVDWTNSCAPMVTTGCEITANFESMTREYLITFVDGDGKTIQTGMVMYGDTPAYTGAEIPNKTATAQTGYTFNDSWSPEIHPVDGPETYTAEFNETTRSYDITWNYRDENGVRTGKTINVEYGRNPTEPSLPLVSQTAQTGYTFTGWNPSVSEVTTGRTYTAQYDETIREYLIKFIDGNGIVIQSGMVAYGATPTYTGIETPTKTATPQYSYNFNYTWDPEIVPVTTGAEYIAQFNEVVNKYTIIWNNEDGILLEMDENVPYGTMPEYNGATPIKTGDEIGNYVFNGWTPTPVSVVGDAVYRAKYKEKETPEDGRKGNKWSGGGGGIEKSSDSYKNTGDIMIIENLVDGNQDSNIHGSALGENGEEIMVPLITKQNMRKYSELVINSYIWAFENDVTTVGEFDKANPEGYVLRGHLAKMMVNFSANVLGREIPIDIPVSCEWEDDSSEWESPEIKFYAKKACALGIMGIKVKKFEPNKTVSRAEFGTVLSRVLWGDKYDVRNPTRKNRYYTRHLQILKEKGVMSQTENPLDRIELRKWIWVMLRRAQELK